MIKSFERMIILRYLRSKNRESFISIVSVFSLIGIALGVAALIVVMSVMNGFRVELTNKIVGFDGDIMIFNTKEHIKDFDSITNIIKANPNICNAFAVVEQKVLVNYLKNSVGVNLRGMDLDDLKTKKIIYNNIIKGDLSHFHNVDILIGSELALSLGLDIGSEIKVIIPEINHTIIGSIPKFKTFKVIAIFKAGMSEYDKTSVFIPLKTAQNIFGFGDSVNIIETYSIDPQKSMDVARELWYQLGGAPYRVIDWQEKNELFFSSLKTERIVMFIILTLIVLVAAFNIISGLIMLVKDKTFDIAILRTMGASRYSIIRIFVVVGSVLGIIGTICGVILGISFAYNIEHIKKLAESVTGSSIFDPMIYYLSALPVKIMLSDIIKIISLSLGLSFLATIYPAYRAAKLEPIEALRYS